MVERKFILLGDKRAYNRKVPGKWPKGLTSDAWNNYNNWLAAGIMWQGFINGHDPEYKVHFGDTHDIDARIEDLLCPDYKPLWAMKQAYDNAGHTANGREMGSVELPPMAIWVEYMKGVGTGIRNWASFRARREISQVAHGAIPVRHTVGHSGLDPESSRWRKAPYLFDIR